MVTSLVWREEKREAVYLFITLNDDAMLLFDVSPSADGRSTPSHINASSESPFTSHEGICSTTAVGKRCQGCCLRARFFKAEARLASAQAGFVRSEVATFTLVDDQLFADTCVIMTIFDVADGIPFSMPVGCVRRYNHYRLYGPSSVKSAGYQKHRL